ncbi:MAG TPA: TonB-dependent receptor [Kofleriaceae bacterium]|nr:TonB-dependent receptor [Kofleriaceae bacterium]
MKRLLAVAVVVAARVATAQAQGAYVDVQDLPPLPPESEEQSSSATLLAASQVEEDVVVGAAKREQSLGNVASAVTVVSGDRLRRFGYRTVGEALSGVAGVYLADSRVSYSLGIRGLNIPGDFNTRILVLVDGASVNEAWGSFAGLGFESLVSIDDIARIELIRGPVSSVYGANAFFGIVNIVTRSAAETPRAWGRASINSLQGAISSAGFATGGVHQQVRGTVSFMNRFGETVATAPGIGTNLGGDGSQTIQGAVVGSYKGSFAQLRAYRYFRDSPFAPYLADPSDPRPFRAYDTQLLLEGGHAHEVSKRLSITGRGYANIYRYSDDIVQVMPKPRFLDYGDGKSFGGELRGRYELIAPQKLGVTFGTEANYNITKSRAFEEGDEANAAVVPKNFNIEGVYSEIDGQPTDWLGFTGGLRFDRNSVIDSRVSPRIALFVAQPEKYGAKLLLAQGFRNPSAYEAFFHDDVSFSQPHDLGAETIRSAEAVLWAKPVPGLSTRLSGFYWSASDVVVQLPDPDDPTGVLLQFQNAAQFVTEGVELEGSYRTSRGWYGFAGATYARVGAAEDAASEVTYGDVPNAPKLTGAFGISTPKLFDRAHLSTELLYIGERPSRPDTDTGDPLEPSPAWIGWNASVYVPDLRGFDITAGVRNLIGKRDHVVAPGDFDRYDESSMQTTTVPFIPGEGRELYVKVGYSY